jgi:hypothetical protein
MLFFNQTDLKVLRQFSEINNRITVFPDHLFVIGGNDNSIVGIHQFSETHETEPFELLDVKEFLDVLPTDGNVLELNDNQLVIYDKDLIAVDYPNINTDVIDRRKEDIETRFENKRLRLRIDFNISGNVLSFLRRQSKRRKLERMNFLYEDEEAKIICTRQFNTYSYRDQKFIHQRENIADTDFLYDKIDYCIHRLKSDDIHSVNIEKVINCINTDDLRVSDGDYQVTVKARISKWKNTTTNTDYYILVRLSRDVKTLEFRKMKDEGSYEDSVIPRKQRRYEEKSNLLLSEEYNPTFEKILWMSEKEFKNWVKGFREFVINEFDGHEFQPAVFADEKKVLRAFKKLDTYDINKDDFIFKDDITGKNDILKHSRYVGVTKQFFPAMSKTGFDNDYSLYEFLKKKELSSSVEKALARSFKYDGFYVFSDFVYRQNENSLFKANTGKEWIKRFREVNPSNYDFWIFEEGEEKTIKDYGKRFLTQNKKEIKKLITDGLIEKRQLTNCEFETDKYLIKLFKKGNRLFPTCFRALTKGRVHTVNGFPEYKCKYLYTEYTKHIKDDAINIYDFSAGWGNRLLAALSVNRPVHYIGTDPNTENLLPEPWDIRYNYLGKVFNESVRKSDFFTERHQNTYHIFDQPAEDIHKHKDFQQYKRKVDLVFSSPPYWGREQYSDDETQAHIRYPQYQQWLDGFLRPTFTTAYEWLKNDRYFLVNIADLKIGSGFIPLEKDTIDILKSLGLKYVDTLKMILNTTAKSVSQSKNVCEVNGKAYKFEPIFVFKKLQ